MKKILVINGPNLNMLGTREPSLYGEKSYRDLKNFIKKTAKELGVKVTVKQTNYEGKMVEIIQKAYRRYDGIVLNAAAYTHTSVAVLDALKAVRIKTCEVHLTDINQREDFRKVDFVSKYAFKTICGEGFNGYKKALESLL